VSALLLDDASKPATPLTNGAVNQTGPAALCPTQRQWLSLAGWLSWIVNINRSSVQAHPEQHNQLDLSLGCLGATYQARSTLITQPVSGVAGLSASSDILRGSVATHLRCGGICSESFITNFLLILTMNKFWKSVNIWWSYEAYNKWCHFWPTLYIANNTNLKKNWLRGLLCKGPGIMVSWTPLWLSTARFYWYFALFAVLCVTVKLLLCILLSGLENWFKNQVFKLFSVNLKRQKILGFTSYFICCEIYCILSYFISFLNRDIWSHHFATIIVHGVH